jgi:hypothetical protein
MRLRAGQEVRFIAISEGLRSVSSTNLQKSGTILFRLVEGFHRLHGPLIDSKLEKYKNEEIFYLRLLLKLMLRK